MGCISYLISVAHNHDHGPDKMCIPIVWTTWSWTKEYEMCLFSTTYVMIESFKFDNHFNLVMYWNDNVTFYSLFNKLRKWRYRKSLTYSVLIFDKHLGNLDMLLHNIPLQTINKIILLISKAHIREANINIYTNICEVF